MKANKRALYAGTFDVFTNGHNDILNKALKIFDEVFIVVAASPVKKTILTDDEREEMLNHFFSDNPRVKIAKWDGLVVDFAKEHGINFAIRGVRPIGDFEQEFQLAAINKKLNADFDTIFLLPEASNYSVSSTFVKEIMGHGGDISPLVPAKIFDYISKHCKKKGE